MPIEMPFGQVLDAADRLSPEDQRQLIDILNRRLAEAERSRIAADIRESRAEFAAGRTRPVTPDELMREIMK